MTVVALVALALPALLMLGCSTSSGPASGQIDVSNTAGVESIGISIVYPWTPAGPQSDASRFREAP